MGTAQMTRYRRGTGPTKKDRKPDRYLTVLAVVLLAIAAVGIVTMVRRELQVTQEIQQTANATQSVVTVETTDPESTMIQEVILPGQEDIIPEGMTLATRFKLPPGFERVPQQEGSFGAWLRELPMKADGMPVLLYNGTTKEAQVHTAIVDMDVGEKDLQQCADAIMRLRAEWLWSVNRQEQVSFHLTNGFVCDYHRWRRGYRLEVDGNDVHWIKAAGLDSGYTEFRNYLDTVFMYAGTQSLEKETQAAAWSAMRPGDMLVQGGSPGHAVLVADMAVNRQTGETIFLLLQSYMPAQEMHILKNMTDSGPWYTLSQEDNGLETPEWSFSKGSLRRYQ